MMQANPLLPENPLPDGDRGCGERLRKTRMAAGLTQADVAARLKMPVSVVQSLEEENWGRLGAPVFVRGQLRSYSRLLGLTTAPMVAASGVAPIEPPVLVPRTFTPPMRRMAEQLARRLVYIVLTAAIAVPVWLATRPHMGVIAHDSAPLDVSPVPGSGAGTNVFGEGSSRSEPGPLVASLAPMTSSAGTAVPIVSLRINADSWVEVVAIDGTVLEQSTLRAGQERHYRAGQVGRIVLGNAEAVSVREGSGVLDVTPYVRSNVARFTVSSDGSLAPVAD